MACIFCGGTGKRGAEHVVPEWLGPVLKVAQVPTGIAPSGREIRHRFMPPQGDNSPPREWSTDVPDLVTKAVCLECNNGWLSDLEGRAAPLVAPMVRGYSTSLGSENQRTVATWTYKTVLLFQLLRRAGIRAIQPARFAELHALRHPPTDARVWLGATHGGHVVQETSTQVNLATANATVPGFFTALALGNLLILCAGRIAYGGERVRVGSRGHTRATVPVWPASVRPVAWPPPSPLENLDVRALMQEL
jgi:hypothetical protein